MKTEQDKRFIAESAVSFLAALIWAFFVCKSMAFAQGAGSQAPTGVQVPTGQSSPSTRPSPAQKTIGKPQTTPVQLPSPGLPAQKAPGVIRITPDSSSESDLGSSETNHFKIPPPVDSSGNVIKRNPPLLLRSDDPTSELEESHDRNSVVSVEQLRLHSAVRADSFKPIRLEVSYDQAITLEEALKYAIDNNLAVKISRENLNYQNYVLYGQVANMLPNLTMAYNLTRTDIFNEKITSLATVFLTRVSYPVFQGGNVVQSILGQYYRAKGWHQAFKASISDELLDLYQKYNAVLLNRALLQIRAKAVEVSQEQLHSNTSTYQSGTGTSLAVAQAVAQLATDKQALLQQQVTMRNSALQLNFSMNFPMAVNLVPVEELIIEKSLFPANATMDTLVNLALRNRPELREYEDFKVAAARNVYVAAAPLYPQLSFFTQFSYTDTVARSTAKATDTTTTSSSGASGTSTAGAGVFGGLFQTYQEGLALVWSLNNMGLTSVANIYAAQSLNRQAQVQANQELQTVIQSIHTDYLNWRAAREQIDNAALGVRASTQELRIAQSRLDAGVGTNLEVIQGQRDFINSLTTQVQAIVNSNLAQAQLLHDTGLISSNSLLHGYKGNLQ